MLPQVTTREKRVEDPFLTSQLIAYIGNKRALLGFLHGVFSRLASRHHLQTFSDPFAGSGAVSRLAKHMGLSVFSNDWEPYAYTLNRAHIAIDKQRAAELFGGPKGLENAVRELSSRPASFTPHISRHYAPRNTLQADYRTERLFYSRENAEFIDRVRSAIESDYPGWNLSADDLDRKHLLLSSLLYQAATHANTSGVFKAYHKGFGGHGKDALGRILAPMQLQVPVLIDGQHPCEVFQMDAAQFASGRTVDLTYLDPPYNSHQYGSNYFMLNTVLLWDRLPVDNERDENGRLRRKAGIRPDWTRTRSAYCYRDSAPGAFRELLERIDSRLIAVSYSTDGIIPLEELADIMSEHGELTLHARDYVKYRGGKQSIKRKIGNVEFLLVTNRRRRGSRADRKALDEFLLRRELADLLTRSYRPELIRACFTADEENVIIPGVGDEEWSLPMNHLFRFTQPFPDLTSLAIERVKALTHTLSKCVCHTYVEEVEAIMGIIESNSLARGERTMYSRRLIWCLRKFAFKKYRDEFTAAYDAACVIARKRREAYPELLEQLEEVRKRAHLRFDG